MKNYFLVTVLLVLLSFIVSCSNSNPVSSANATYFMLSINHIVYDNKNDIRVYFSTSNLSQVPTVTINNQNIEEFDISISGIYGTLIGLPYSDSIRYSISMNGKTTSGIIGMPDDPTNISVNNVELSEDESIQVNYSNTYNYTWNCNSYDYFQYYWASLFFSERKTIIDNSISFDSDSSEHYVFGLSAVNGVLPLPGASPNVTGEYGSGYISAESDTKYYRFEVSGTTQTKMVNYYENKVEKRRRVFNEFRKFLETKK